MMKVDKARQYIQRQTVLENSVIKLVLLWIRFEPMTTKFLGWYSTT